MAANVPDVADNDSNAPLQRRSLGRGNRRVQALANMEIQLVMRAYKKGLLPTSQVPY